MKRKLNILLVSFLSFSVVSCSFLDLEPNIIEAGTFYNSEREVLYGLAGVYGAINNEALYGNYYSLMISNVDDLSYFNRSTTQNFTQMYTHDASSSEIYAAWTELYAGVKNANAFMEAVAESEYDPEHKYYNEARFLRAFYHFLLAQAWGDVPLKTEATTNPMDVMCKATSQLKVLQWVAGEMEACLELADESLENAPSRVTKVTMQGILARVYLFMAGESVKGNEGLRHEYFGKARNFAWEVIRTARGETDAETPAIKLNPSYSQVFINMISNVYDKTYNESLWEADFLGDRSSPSNWTNGRIGDLIGLQSNGSDNFSEWACNYSYAQYDGSLKLWNLYWHEDRTDAETDLAGPMNTDLTDETKIEGTGWDKRQIWNMCPYNYAGNDHVPPYPNPGEYDGTDENGQKYKAVRSYDKTPYVVNKVTTSQDPTIARGIRNCGKYRREVQYEGQMIAKDLYTCINYPILRYSDVLLMFAEADNEYNNGPSQDGYDCVVEVRDRAGIETRAFGEYDYLSFREFVRNERGRELCFESLRKYDLIRWGIFVDAMQDYLTDTEDENWPAANAKADYARGIGAAVQEKHVLLPIPSIELGVNTLLVQNELW